MITCPKCGAYMPEAEKFCMRCGQSLDVPQAGPVKSSMPPVAAGPRPVMTPPPPQGPAVYRPGKRSSRIWLWIGVAVAVVVVVLLVLFFIGVFHSSQLIVDQVTNTTESVAKIDATWETKESLPTAFYNNSTERLIRVKLKADKNVKVTVSVEIPQITEKESRTIDVTTVEKPYDFKPPFLASAYGPLDKAQDKYIQLKVVDAQGSTIIDQSVPIRVLSREDMVWVEKDGTQNYEQIARWVTKDSKEVGELVRHASDYNQQLCGQSAMVGYLGDETMVACQLASIFMAMQDYYKIKYIASTESYQTSNAQKIRLPEEVLTERSGLCIETTILVAAALENLGMEPVIIIIPGHAWVAVRAYAGAPYYFHLETTMLDSSVLDAMSTAEEEWMQNSGNVVAIVDIKKVRDGGILPFGETSGEPTKL